jgi:hypothetical protein
MVINDCETWNSLNERKNGNFEEMSKYFMHPDAKYIKYIYHEAYLMFLEETNSFFKLLVVDLCLQYLIP